MKNRNICVVTGTRAEYGLLRSVMRAIQEEGSLNLQLLVTGMHLSLAHGTTIEYIEKDGFKIDAQVPMTPEGDSSYEMAKSIGVGISGLSEALERLQPDVVIVLGDRVEALSAAIAAAYMGIYVAHIHGGDSAEAGLDENARHAITKISHIHFPATKKSEERILKMGENRFRVFLTGAPGLDDIEEGNFPSKEEISTRYGLDLSRPSVLLVQHSVSTEVEDAEHQMEETLAALAKLEYQTIAIYPNSDAGGQKIIKILESVASSVSWLKLFKSIPRSDYLGLLNAMSVLVGNSSSAMIESASFRIPAIDIGTRQRGRECGSNVLHAYNNQTDIKYKIEHVLTDSDFQKKLKGVKNPYSSGRAGENIARVLSIIQLDKNILKKKISY